MDIILCDSPQHNIHLANIVSAYSEENDRLEQDMDYIAKILTSPNETVMAGFAALGWKGNTVGGATVATGPAHKSPELRTTYVLPSHRNQGIGKQLIVAQVSWVFNQGYEKVYSTCMADNKTAIGMLMSAGFQIEGEDPVDEGCIVLSLSQSNDSRDKL